MPIRVRRYIHLYDLDEMFQIITGLSLNVFNTAY